MGEPAFSRVFAMPNSNTLSVAPMRDFVRRYIVHGRSVDPFARNCRMADVTNDLNPDTAALYHMDAEVFCHMLADKGERFDVAIFDPPYSPRQIAECYQQVGRTVGQVETQSAALYRRVRDALDSIICPGGIVLSFGWHSNGMGKGRGYEIVEMLIVAHGGAHNDTICMAERKLAKPATLFAEAA